MTPIKHGIKKSYRWLNVFIDFIHITVLGEYVSKHMRMLIISKIMRHES